MSKMAPELPDTAARELRVVQTCVHAHCVCVHAVTHGDSDGNEADLKRVPPTGQKRYHLGSVPIKIAMD